MGKFDGMKKVELNNTWNYKEEGKGATFKGTYVSKEDNVGENNSTVYSMENEQGEPVQIWGSTVLDTRFKNLKFGEEVGVEYLGEFPSPNRKGKTYHNFEVYHRERPMVKVEEQVPMPEEE